MCFGKVPEKEIVKAFDVSLILYAEHSFNVSTFTARTITSSLSDIHGAITGAIASLKGPLHGGANEEVMYIKEIDGNNIIVNRGQFSSVISEHYTGDVVNQVDATDSAAIEVGDDFGFSESRSFFDNDGLTFSGTSGTDVEAP